MPGWNMRARKFRQRKTQPLWNERPGIVVMASKNFENIGGILYVIQEMDGMRDSARVGRELALTAHVQPSGVVV